MLVTRHWFRGGCIFLVLVFVCWLGMRYYYWNECPSNSNYLFFLNSFCYPWGSFGYQNVFPRIILWFDYLCVDHTLSLLHGGSGSLIRWPCNREIVYSYHVGPPQIDTCWMFLDIVVPLSFFLLSWILLFIWCIYVSCIFEVLWDIVLYIDVLVSIFTYPMTCVVDVIH